MKKAFLDNKNTQKVLITFCEQPNRFFALKELSSRTGIPESRIKAAVRLMEQGRVLNVAEKKRQKYYQIDRRSVLFGELSKIFSVSPRPIERDFISRLVLSSGDIKYAALSGIFIGMPKLDADLLIVGKISPARLKKCIDTLENIMANEINYAEMTEREFRERLYSFDWFLKEIREKNPIVLVDKLTKERKKN